MPGELKVRFMAAEIYFGKVIQGKTIIYFKNYNHTIYKNY